MSLRISFGGRTLSPAEQAKVKAATAGHVPARLPSLQIGKWRLMCMKCQVELGTFGEGPKEDGRVIGRWLGHLEAVVQRTLGRAVTIQ